MLGNLYLWSDAVLLSAFILLIQFAGIVRPLLSARQPFWKYALVVLALLVSLFSFVVAIHAKLFGEAFFAVIHEHLNLEAYLRLQADVSYEFICCMVQTCLLVIMIVLLWGVKRT